MTRSPLVVGACLLAVTTGGATALATGHPAHHKSAAPPHLACSGNPATLHRLDITVAGQPAWGLYAVPQGKANGIVVFDHGYTHTAWSWADHIRAVAKRDHVIAIAMDYRGQHDFAPAKGQKLPSSRGWRVQEGADDSIAAAKLFDNQCKTRGVNTVYGISMGGNTSGLVLAADPKRANGKPLFDYWFAIEPAVNMTETWAEASAIGPSGNTFANNAVADIEEENGGKTPAEAPDSYRQRTVSARIADIAASGVQGVVVVQGVDDGLVPYNQSRELVAELRAERIAVDDVTVATRGKGEPGTTATGYALGPLGLDSPLAGHASEVSDTQLVGVTGFALLDDLYLKHHAPACHESVRDGDTGQWQVSPATC